MRRAGPLPEPADRAAAVWSPAARSRMRAVPGSTSRYLSGCGQPLGPRLRLPGRRWRRRPGVQSRDQASACSRPQPRTLVVLEWLKEHGLRRPYSRAVSHYFKVECAGPRSGGAAWCWPDGQPACPLHHRPAVHEPVLPRHGDTCTSTFIGALSTIAKEWNQPRWSQQMSG